VTPEIPIDRVHELIDRSYWSRVDVVRSRRRPREW
jgi:hypothetical protein